MDESKISEDDDCVEKMEVDEVSLIVPVVNKVAKSGTSYKIATANHRDIRIWEFHFEPEKKDGQEPTTALRGERN
jgi:hypothetical protein